MGQVNSSWVKSSQVRTGQVVIFLSQDCLGLKFVLTQNFVGRKINSLRQVKSIWIKSNYVRADQVKLRQVKSSQKFFWTQNIFEPNFFFIVIFSKSVTHNFLRPNFVKKWKVLDPWLLWPKTFSKRDQVDLLLDCWILWVQLELGTLGTRVWPCSA